jgi:hypothetical protein
VLAAPGVDPVTGADVGALGGVGNGNIVGASDTPLLPVVELLLVVLLPVVLPLPVLALLVVPPVVLPPVVAGVELLLLVFPVAVLAPAAGTTPPLEVPLDEELVAVDALAPLAPPPPGIGCTVVAGEGLGAGTNFAWAACREPKNMMATNSTKAMATSTQFSIFIERPRPCSSGPCSGCPTSLSGRRAGSCSGGCCGCCCGGSIYNLYR